MRENRKQIIIRSQILHFTFISSIAIKIYNLNSNKILSWRYKGYLRSNCTPPFAVSFRLFRIAGCQVSGVLAEDVDWLLKAAQFRFGFTQFDAFGVWRARRLLHQTRFSLSALWKFWNMWKYEKYVKFVKYVKYLKKTLKTVYCALTFLKAFCHTVWTLIHCGSVYQLFKLFDRAKIFC